MGKRIIAFLLTAVMLCASAHAYAAAPTITSAAACIMDADTGQVLYEKNADQELPMASITKVMTALLVLENGDLSAVTTATEQALNSVEPASTRVGFVPNEQISVDTLMYCMLVNSANDAANILAAYVAGDVDSFVKMMNARAIQLGCTHTHFANPNGLDAEGHYSSAHDMARILYAANQYEAFRKYSSTVNYVLPADNVISIGWEIWTKIDMLRPETEVYDARIYAGKTGWTTNAHNTFVSCGRSEKANLIVSVLNCEVKNGIFLDTKALLDYGEQAYPAAHVAAADYAQAAEKAARHAHHRIDVDALQDFTVHLPQGTTTDDLVYRCETTPTGANLIISLAPEKQETYAQETGLHNLMVMRRIALPMATDPEIPSLQQMLNQQYPTENRDNSWWNRLPEYARIAITIAVFVAGAILLLFILLFLLGLFRRIRNRRSRKKRKKK